LKSKPSKETTLFAAFFVLVSCLASSSAMKWRPHIPPKVAWLSVDYKTLYPRRQNLAFLFSCKFVSNVPFIRYSDCSIDCNIESILPPSSIYRTGYLMNISEWKLEVLLYHNFTKTLIFEKLKELKLKLKD
jgi:hypothetical protein